MSLNELKKISDELKPSERMPVMFIGHGSPMNALEDNAFTRGWRAAAQALPRPQAILCVSAHWQTPGTMVTAMEHPKTIHDFGGFPRELFEAQYPAPGSPALAKETQQTIQKTPVTFDDDWGLDHGTWSILKPMFPDADVPVIQLSLDYRRPAQYHYDLAKELAPLREKGVLIVGSGNIVHNLRRVALPPNGDFNQPYAFDWALEARDIVRKKLDGRDHTGLVDYAALGQAIQLAVPTPEHYLPMLYAIALQRESESITYFNDVPVAGSLTMTSLLIQ
ncbi:MAG: 4,5-DOPA dioxygenase extradiol [Anaerolineae bacterium]|nr:4,5-DOPA dioxygenase extradiol [Thermoflexales bacterium]